MANLKTTQLASADTLDGTELVAIVQNNQSVQTTTYAIGNISNNLPVVHIGRNSEASGDYAIAIGYAASTFGGSGNMALGARSAGAGNSSTAIGFYAAAVGYLDTAIGNNASATNFASLACGNHTTAQNTYAIAIGAYANAGAYGRGSIAVGGYSFADAEHSVAIGYSARVQSSAPYSVAIGAHAGSYAEKTVTIGYRCFSYGSRSVAIGYRTFTEGGYAVAIGSYAYASSNYTTAVGAYAHAYPQGATAIGSYTQAAGSYSTAFGTDAAAYSPYSTALGSSAKAAANSAMAIGYNSFDDQDSSIVLGDGTHDIALGSLVVCGYPNDGMLNPVEHYQKFVASTVPSSSASFSFSGDDYSGTIIAPPGAAGNNYVFSVVDPGAPNVTLQVNFDGTLLAVTLGTDGSGTLDNTQNTITNLAALFPASGFTFESTGNSSGILQLFAGPLSGGTDGNPTVAMSVDGNAASPGNRPEMWPGALATLTGHVTGCVPDLFASAGDTATFVLTPLLLYRKYDSTYIFVNEPTFILESSTDGSSGWDVPVFTDYV